MGSEWDERLRAALLEAARLDGEADFAALSGEPDFSQDYLRERERLLRDPFRYAKRRSRSRRKAVLWYAACALMTLCLSAVLVLATNPAARAWGVQMWSTWHPEYTEYNFQGDGTEPAPLGVWRPTYVPEGYVERDSAHYPELSYIDYKNREGTLLSLTYFPLGEQGSILLDNEHSTLHPAKVNGLNADLYVAIEPDDPSTVIWVDAGAEVVFSLHGILSKEELLYMAESVAPVS